MIWRASSASCAKWTSPPLARTLPLVGLEIKVEMGERVVLDRAGAVAQRVELGQPGGRGRSTTDKIARK